MIISTATIASAADYVGASRRHVVGGRHHHARCLSEGGPLFEGEVLGLVAEPRPDNRTLLFFAHPRAIPVVGRLSQAGPGARGNNLPETCRVEQESGA